MRKVDGMYIIGVDNGFGYTKTESATFITGVKNYGSVKPPLLEKVIYYNNEYFGIGGERKKVKQEDKTADDETYILTLAAISNELKNNNLREADIVLAVGLPLENCGRDSAEFSQYFMRGDTEFEYDGEQYKIHIEKVYVFPQGYSVIASELKDIKNDTVLLDIGSWTTEIMPIVDGNPVVGECVSLKEGAIPCMNAVNEALRREIGKEIRETQIQDVMRGKKNILPEKYEEIVVRTIREYAVRIVSLIEEKKFNTDTLQFIICGGASCIIKNYGIDLFASVRTIPDVNANAVGYERIAEAKYRREKQK